MKRAPVIKHADKPVKMLPVHHPQTGKFVKTNGVGTPQQLPYNLTSTIGGSK